MDVGMNENQLRDTKMQPKASNVPNLPNPVAPTTTTNNFPGTDSSSLNLINFLTSMTKATLEVCDPEYKDIQPHEWTRICQEQCNRNIGLIEGIKNPEKVCPRTKWDFSCSRTADKYDIAFIWYRSFVSIVDWANNIPEFRMLPAEDQAQLLRVNFTNLTFMIYSQCPEPPEPHFVPMGNGAYIGNEQMGYYITIFFNSSLTYFFQDK